MTIDLEDVPNEPLNPQSAVIPPAQPKLTSSDAAEIAKIPGVNQGALANMAPQQQLQVQPIADQSQQTPPPMQMPAPQPASQTTTSSTQTVLSPEGKKALQGLKEANDLQVQAAQQMSDVQVKKAEIATQEKGAIAQNLAEQQQQLQAHANEVAQTGKEHTARINQAIADFKATKVDPDHWWNSRTTGQKIAASLAMAFDAMGAAWSRSGRTPAIDRINHAIQQDIEGQKLAYEAKARGVEMAQTAYSAARQAGADDATAQSAVRLAGYNKLIADGEARLAQTAAPEQQAAGQQAIAQLRTQAAQESARYAELTAKHVTSSTTTVKGGAGTPQQQTASGLANDIVRMAKEGVIKVRDWNGLRDLIASGRMPPKVAEQLQAAYRMTGLRKDITEAVNAYHDAPVNSEAATRAQNRVLALRNDLKGQAALAKGSALTAEESADIDKNIPEPSRTIVPGISSEGLITNRKKELAAINGQIDGLIAPVQGNLRGYFMDLGGAATGEGGGATPVSKTVKNGRVFVKMSDGSFRDGGAAP